MVVEGAVGVAEEKDEEEDEIVVEARVGTGASH